MEEAYARIIFVGDEILPYLVYLDSLVNFILGVVGQTSDYDEGIPPPIPSYADNLLGGVEHPGSYTSNVNSRLPGSYTSISDSTEIDGEWETYDPSLFEDVKPSSFSEDKNETDVDDAKLSSESLIKWKNLRTISNLQMKNYGAFD